MSTNLHDNSKHYNKFAHGLIHNTTATKVEKSLSLTVPKIALRDVELSKTGLLMII